MKTTALAILFCAAAVASACGDFSYRCFNPDESDGQAWRKTEACAMKVGPPGESCWCHHRAEYYMSVGQGNAEAFRKCCAGSDGWYAREC
jgi:hypothetical protein